MSTHTSLLLLLLATSSTTITASAILSPRQSGSIFLGRPCTPGSTTCLGGAQCYAVNSMLIPTCGSFGAGCSSSAQCATNTCVNGACNGPVAPVLPLGSACYESAQCVNEAACYAVNAMQIPSCGNFQAQCVGDSQCAFNTCVDGFCNGAPLASSSSVASTVVVPTTSVSATSASPTAPTSTTSPPTTSSSGPSSSLSSSVIVPSTSVPTTGSTETVTTFTTTTSCPSVSTTVPPPTGTGHSSVIGNSTSTTTAQPSPTLFQGAGEQVRAGIGSIIVAAALAFALMIGA